MLARLVNKPDSDNQPIESEKNSDGDITPESPVSKSFDDETTVHPDTHSFGSGDAVPPEFLPLAPPASLGRYEIKEVLGAGGFGKVYKARDLRLDRYVAIKVSRRMARGLDQEALLSEARILAKLRHPGIVTVYDFGIDNECSYIVTDYLEGPTLAEYISGKRLGWQEACQLCAKIADALAHSHANQMTHRDVKPSNIILIQGEPVLFDFGLALTAASDLDPGVEIVGTPGYMSPEQAQGLAHRVDGKTDIYSLGVVFYRMLTGTRPHTSTDTIKLLRQIREDDPQPPRQLVPDLPRNVEEVCLNAMARDTSKRYSSATDFSLALRAVLPDENSSRKVTPPVQMTTPDDHASGTRSTLRRAREAERRQVTVMAISCELAGDDSFLDMLEVEVQHEFTSILRECVEQAAQEFDGAVITSGHQLSILSFGYPIAHEDSAQRAVHAARAVFAKVAEINVRLNQEFGQQLELGAVIHSGTAIAEDSGSEDTTRSVMLVGEARNVTSQLAAVCPLANIVVTESTAKLLQGLFLLVDFGEQTLRGRKTAIPLFCITDAATSRNRVELIDPRDLSPLVGRRSELTTLADRWEFAEDGSWQVVTIGGEPGLGKSRLVRELKDLVRKRNESTTIIEWRCSAYHMGSQFYPAVEFFEQLLAFDHNEHSISRLDKIVEYLSSHQLTESNDVALLAALLSIPLDDRYPALELSPQRQLEETMALLGRWLQSLSDAGPFLFLVEDLHWIDPTSLEFIAGFVDQGFGDGSLTVLTFRPEFQAPWSTLAHIPHLALTRLKRRQVVELLESRLGNAEVPEIVVNQILQRTEGIPLFIEEFATLLQESGRIEDIDEDSVSSVMTDIPSTLQDLLAARLDRLDSDPEIIQYAATIGREFDYRVLHAVARRDEVLLREELQKLIQAEILFQKGRIPDCRFIFKHALLQDAAYGSLLSKKQKQFHKQIGETLVSMELAESQPELLAHHFTAADELARGLEFWISAGQLAQSRSAVNEAIAHYSRGLDVVARLPEGPEQLQAELGLQLPLGSVLIQAKGYAAEEVLNAFNRAQEICEVLGEGAPLFHVLLGKWMFHAVRSEFHYCLEIATRLMEMAEKSGDDGLIMEAGFPMANSLHYHGQFAQALAVSEKSIPLYDEERCRFHSQFTGQNCGVAVRMYGAIPMWHLGRADDGLALMQDAVDLADQLNDPFSHALSLYHCGWLNLYCGNADRTRECGNRSLAISKEQGFVFFEMLSYVNQAAADLQQETPGTPKFEKALELLQQGIAGFKMTGAGMHLTHPYLVLADAYRRSERPDEAAAQIDLAFAHLSESGEVFARPEIVRQQGLLAVSNNEPQVATRMLQSSVELAREFGSLAWELRATLSLFETLVQVNSGDAVSTLGDLETLRQKITQGATTMDVARADKILQRGI